MYWENGSFLVRLLYAKVCYMWFLIVLRRGYKKKHLNQKLMKWHCCQRCNQSNQKLKAFTRLPLRTSISSYSKRIWGATKRVACLWVEGGDELQIPLTPFMYKRSFTIGLKNDGIVEYIRLVNGFSSTNMFSLSVSDANLG